MTRHHTSVRAAAARDFRLDLRRSLRAGRAQRLGWQTLLEVHVWVGRWELLIHRGGAPEPFQAPI